MQDQENKNPLFPIFLKMENLRLLIVGGGYVGHEKLTAILQNSPTTTIRLVGIEIHQAIVELSSHYPTVTLHQKTFDDEDMENIAIAIIAINDKETSKAIYLAAKSKGILVNVADTPDLCDFYLGSIVQKGNLKIAISTNGQSPTIAKRLKEVLIDTLPQELDEILQRMHIIRDRLKGNFGQKVLQLNELTKGLVEKDP